MTRLEPPPPKERTLFKHAACKSTDKPNPRIAAVEPEEEPNGPGSGRKSKKKQKKQTQTEAVDAIQPGTNAQAQTRAPPANHPVWSPEMAAQFQRFCQLEDARRAMTAPTPVYHTPMPPTAQVGQPFLPEHYSTTAPVAPKQFKGKCTYCEGAHPIRKCEAARAANVIFCVGCGTIGISRNECQSGYCVRRRADGQNAPTTLPPKNYQ